jgi:hypothetical protein
MIVIVLDYRPWMQSYAIFFLGQTVFITSLIFKKLA